MKILRVNAPIVVYKTVVFEVKVPDEIDIEKLKKEIIYGGYDALINGGMDLLDKCEISEINEYVRDIESSEMYCGDITEIKEIK